MRFVIVGYRDWARSLHYQLSRQPLKDAQGDWVRVEWQEGHVNVEVSDVVFFVGWSELIPQHVIDVASCYVLHPSPLPLYRGGSPIQHQILRGEGVSAVTIFRILSTTRGVDTGPIAFQMPYSLGGELSDVLEQIARVGSYGVEAVIRTYLSGHEPFLLEQPEGVPPLRRRRPEESEISLEDLQTEPAAKLYNKIRALQDPYPNAFFRCADGNKLYLTRAHL